MNILVSHQAVLSTFCNKIAPMIVQDIVLLKKSGVATPFPPHYIPDLY